MGSSYEAISDRLEHFLLAQPVFFVATAPLAATGHVNCSPKGGSGDFVVLDPRTVAFRDKTGSGAETAAHLRENGRIVLMWCAFDGPPRIVRLHGRGELVLEHDRDAEELFGRFAPALGTRAIVRVSLTRISDSCGYGVPLMDFRGHRTNLDHSAEAKGEEGLRDYRRTKNRTSIDGLPAFDPESVSSADPPGS